MHKLCVYKELPLFVVYETELPPITDCILILFFFQWIEFLLTVKDLPIDRVLQNSIFNVESLNS